MRRRDYRCPTHGLFEYLDDFGDAIHEALACPTCGSESHRQVARVTIGKIDRGTFVTDFPGGHTLTRDEVERRLDLKPGVPFENDPTFTNRIAERVDRLMARQDAGELPPRKELSEKEIDTVKKALKTGA